MRMGMTTSRRLPKLFASARLWKRTAAVGYLFAVGAMVTAVSATGEFSWFAVLILLSIGVAALGGRTAGLLAAAVGVTASYALALVRGISFIDTELVLVTVVWFVSTGVVGRLSDQSQKLRKQERSIAALLAEKESVLREVHHRTKNHLNVVMSLIDRTRVDCDGDPAEAIQTLMSRIQMMTSLNDTLYQQESVEAVELAPFLEQIIDANRRIFGDLTHLETTSVIDHVVVGSNPALGIGIVVNELIANGFKYAPSDPHEPMHIVVAEASSGSIGITITTPNPGYADDVITGARRGFGLTLVAGYAEQYRGEFVIENDGDGRGIARVVLSGVIVQPPA